MVGRLPAILFLLGIPSQDAGDARLEALVADAVWARDPLVRSAARRALDDVRAPLSRERAAALEARLRRGPALPVAQHGEARTLTVRVRPGREFRLLVWLPEPYRPSTPHPLLLVLGGGPLPSRDEAAGEILGVARLWREPLRGRGWILAALEDTASVRLEGPELRYLTLRPEDVRAAVLAAAAQYRVDLDRVHLAGISLGGNYAVQFAAALPHAFAGAVPVVSEGESREAVLRNLAGVSLYAINGARDRNIRSIEGPRKMLEIARRLGIRSEGVEEPERGHDGFQDRYRAVLDWLGEARRDPWPRAVVRVPHEGLFPVSRAVAWVEADGDPAAFRVEARGQAIEILAARARRLRLRLGDALLDLDRPFSITVNGRKVFEGSVERRAEALVESAALDPGRPAPAALEVAVPLDSDARREAARWLGSLAPEVEPAALPWWEVYARATLRERRPRADWAGTPLPEAELASLGLGEGLSAIRLSRLDPASPEARAGLRPGDVLLGFDDEVFYRDGPGLELVHERLLRLPELPLSYSLTVLRDGAPLRLSVSTK